MINYDTTVWIEEKSILIKHNVQILVLLGQFWEI